MMSDYWDYGVWKVDCGQNVSTDARMELHFFEFSGSQFAWLVQNVFGHCQFAHVVEKSRRLNRLNQSFI